MHRLKPLNDFIFGKTFGEKGDEVQLLSLLNAILAKTKQEMAFLANDKEVLRLYHLREMAQIDYNSGMKKAKDEGKAEEKIDVARNMKADGEPVEKIMRYTGLTKEVIERLM